MDVLRGVSGRVQQISIDEAFVELSDVKSCWPALIAARCTIFKEIGLSCSFGVAANKLVAKIATSQGKPRGFVVVPPGTQAGFLAPLPVTALWGVGPRTAERLRTLGIVTLGELASHDSRALADTFGPRRALELHDYALGNDDRPLVSERTYKSISSERTFGRGETSARQLWITIQEMAGELAIRLEAQGMVARTVGIKMRLEDWRLVTRDRTLPDHCATAERFAAVAADLMREHWRHEPVRLFGLRVAGLMLKPAPDQLSLFAQPVPRGAGASSERE
jgi:DNA polymerase-4